MKTPGNYFNSLVSTDANCPIDKYSEKYDRFDLVRFAQGYLDSVKNDIWNEAINAAAESACIESPYGEGMTTLHNSINGIQVNKNSILKLKK